MCFAHGTLLCNLMEGRMVGKPTKGRRRTQMLDETSLHTTCFAM